MPTAPFLCCSEFSIWILTVDMSLHDMLSNCYCSEQRLCSYQICEYKEGKLYSVRVFIHIVCLYTYCIVKALCGRGEELCVVMPRHADCFHHAPLPVSWHPGGASSCRPHQPPTYYSSSRRRHHNTPPAVTAASLHVLPHEHVHSIPHIESL